MDADCFHAPSQNFTYRWDRSHAFTVVDVERTAYQTSVQLMFRSVSWATYVSSNYMEEFVRHCFALALFEVPLMDCLCRNA